MIYHMNDKILHQINFFFTYQNKLFFLFYKNFHMFIYFLYINIFFRFNGIIANENLSNKNCLDIKIFKILIFIQYCNLNIISCHNWNADKTLKLLINNLFYISNNKILIR